MLKNRLQGQRFCSSKCRRETIRRRWILLPKLRRGFENQSKNKTAGMARRDYFYDPEAPKPNSIRPAAAVSKEAVWVPLSSLFPANIPSVVWQDCSNDNLKSSLLVMSMRNRAPVR